MGTAPTDSDHDGMPDSWEESNGLNPNDPADAHGTYLSDAGYTNVEVYINGLYQFITTRVERWDTMTPEKFTLEQNYPNPFNPTTSIVYTLPDSRHTLLTVFNVHGRLVKTLSDMQQNAGQHVVQWDGRDENGLSAASGLYFYKLQAGQQVMTRKMMLVR